MRVYQYVNSIKKGVILQLFLLFITLNRAISDTPQESIIGFDKLVATVNEQIITQTDIDIEQKLSEYLPIESVLLQSYRVSNPLASLILQKQIKYLAGNIALYQPSESQIQRRFLAFRSQWNNLEEYQQFLTSTGLTDRRIQGMIANQVLAENYQRTNWGIPLESNSLSNQETLRKWIEKNESAFEIRYIE